MEERGAARLYAVPPALYLLLFFALPVLALLAYATVESDRTLRETVGRILDRPYYTNRILFTFVQAALSTGLTLAVGVPLAYLFSHADWPGRRVLRAALTAPFVLPTIVVALAFQAWLGPHGLVGYDVLGLVGPLGSILLAHVFYNVSLVLRLVGNYWERLPEAFRESAEVLGASPRTARWRVELPLLRPALLAAALLTFVFTFTSFGLILLLGGPRTGTLETLVYEELRSFRPDYATAATLALLQLVTTYGAILLFVRLQRRLTTTWPPKTRVERVRMPWWGVPALLAAAFLVLGPPVALVIASLRTHTGWGPDAYVRLWHPDARVADLPAIEAAGNSLRFALLTLLLALLLAALAALAAHRGRNTFTQSLLLLPLGVSPVIVGLGFLLAWNGRFLPDLRTSVWWIPLAHTLVAFPFASRILLPSLDAVDPRLREAARTLGAKERQVLARLELPLAWPALLVAAIFAFGTSLGEFGAALLLRRPETTTIPLSIYDAVGRPGALFQEQAYALASILLLLAFLSFLVLEWAPTRARGFFV